MTQQDIFSYLYDKLHIGDKKIALIELFGGIGSQHAALRNLEKDGLLPNGFISHRLVEWDKDCVNAYNSIFGTDYVPMDITKVHATDLGINERDKYNYLMVYSFPCQDISISGNMKGFKKEKGTRSGLLWEVERILNECGTELPQVLLLENVKNIISEKFKPDFLKWLDYLESKGYQNYWKVVNSKNVGYPEPVPQNRERVFVVSVLGDLYYQFPKKTKLKHTLSDLLEKNVDKKYYLSDKMVNYILNRTPLGEKGNFANNLIGNDFKRVAGTLTTKGSGGSSARGEDTLIVDNMTQAEIDQKIYLKDSNSVKRVGSYAPSGHNSHSVVDPSGIAPTFMENHGSVTGVVIEDNVKVVGGIGEKKSNDGRQWYQQNRIYDDKVALSVTTSFNPYYLDKKLAIRKLTPREAWRLMAFSDSDYDQAAKVTTQTQLYKQAGNSIVVNVLEALIKEML